MLRFASLSRISFAAWLSVLAAPSFTNAESPRPNILWITHEDSSPNLGCFGDPNATTPNLDRLASQGARYLNAFSVAGVCAPSRSCLITGIYPVSLGSHHMRSSIQRPEGAECFSQWLREAGYYCTNNVKMDYNFRAPKEAWDESSASAHWRNGPEGKPFFSVFNFTTTHEGKIQAFGPGAEKQVAALAPNSLHAPERLTPPPYYPDTPVVRRQWAHYYDLMTVFDGQAGDILQQLDEDGLAGNTVVVYFSDHGVGLPRAKRWVYDSGIHVPAIIRWPGVIEPGTAERRLISFVDFGPTMLSIAGAPIPDCMQGLPFLGDAAVAPREAVFSCRDRMDERYEISRSMRESKFHYIRNFETYRPYDQYISYNEAKPVMQEMRKAVEEGSADEAQRLFFRQTKPVEELFDVESDPHEIHNLAGDPAHRQTLERMRAAVERWMIQVDDLGLIPEALLPPLRRESAEAMTARAAEARLAAPDAADSFLPLLGADPRMLAARLGDDRRIVRLLAAKALGQSAQAAAAPILREALSHDDPAVRYWAATHLGILRDGESAGPLAALAEKDSEGIVRLAASAALYRIAGDEAALEPILEMTKDSGIGVLQLHAADTLDLLRVSTPAAKAAFEAAAKSKTNYVGSLAKGALWRIGREARMENRPK